jgi:hypothetical protein
MAKLESMMSLLFWHQHNVKNAQNLIKNHTVRVHMVLECTVDAFYGLQKKKKRR